MRVTGLRKIALVLPFLVMLSGCGSHLDVRPAKPVPAPKIVLPNIVTDKVEKPSMLP